MAHLRFYKSRKNIFETGRPFINPVKRYDPSPRATRKSRKKSELPLISKYSHTN